MAHRRLPIVLVLSLVVLVSLSASGVAQEAGTAGMPAGSGDATLPVTAVSLFTSGVGYFQHDGIVEGDAEVTLTFSVADVNDLLKSLVLQDFDGGRVEAVTYPSQDPLARILESFSLDLSTNPTLADLLNQARGEPVTVQASGTWSGTIVGVERRTVAGERGSEQVAVLNLLTADGLRQTALSEVRTVRFDDPALQAELDSALAVIAANRQEERKSVTIRFTGTGRRRVRVAYVRAVPVWKTSYRMVLGDDGTAQLQGWAIVENTGESDWRDVSLALVTGLPISFVMDLYTPVYTNRPRVAPPTGVSVAPPVYDRAVPSAPMASARASVAESAADQSFTLRTERAAAPEPIDLTQGVSAAAVTEGGAIYRISHPVSIARRGAALIPIVSRTVPAERLSIFEQSVLASRALQAVRLTNATGVQLPEGPATVFDGAAYAGDARLPALIDGEERLLSFAVDVETTALVRGSAGAEEITRVRIVNGILESTTRQLSTTEYVFDRLGASSGSVLVVHPRRSGWTVVEPARPAGETAAAYRYEVTVGARSAVTLAVREERVRSQTYALTGIRDDQIVFFLSQRAVDARTSAALERLRVLRTAVAEREAARRAIEQRIATIYREQERIRANMGAVDRTTELYRRYLETLSGQEDELAALQQDLERAREAEAAARQALAAHVESL